MKRFFYLFPLLLLTSFPIHAKNKISMVTYFPVPYVAYSQVNADEQMDIGLTNTCNMKLGCSDSSTTLKSAQVNLTGGRLNLNGGRGILGDTLNLGSGSNVGQLSFQNVRIQTGNAESVNSENMTVSALNLFGKPFPSCREKDSSGQMQWASLKLKGASSNELYLTCGEVLASAGCSNTPSNLTESRTCTTGTGTQTRTWNESTCSWGEWVGECIEYTYSWKRYSNEDCWTMLGNSPLWSNGDDWRNYQGRYWDCGVTPTSVEASEVDGHVDPFGVGSSCSSYAARLRQRPGGLSVVLSADISKDCTRGQQGTIYLKYDYQAGSRYGQPNGASGCFAYRCEMNYN